MENLIDPTVSFKKMLPNVFMIANQEMLHLVYVVMSVAEEGKCIWRNAILDKSEIDSLAKTTLSNHKFGELRTIMYNCRRPWHINRKSKTKHNESPDSCLFPNKRTEWNPVSYLQQELENSISLVSEYSITEVQIKTFRFSWAFFFEYLFVVQRVSRLQIFNNYYNWNT